MIIYDAGKGECGERANGNEESRKTSFQVKSVSQLIMIDYDYDL